jgi:xylan 1,4-beta-xylosidase
VAALDDLEGGRGYWAPDISYYKGRFYITATYRLNDTGNVYRKQIVVSSDKPEGPYSKPAIIDEDGIDPSIFNDDDGRRYMLLNRGARIFELNEDATKQISKAELLFYGDNKRAPEGPHLLKKDGYYYLFEAEGGTDRDTE